MSAQTSVLHPIAIAQVMVNFATRYGVDAETCLLGTDITVTQLRDADALISREQEMRLIENLILALPQTPTWCACWRTSVAPNSSSARSAA